ncbi:right-handed parallel beta-helix repeat-containing protein [Rhodoferax sp. 4810]|nr:right-handed parallel beta-helix repeat-containing protein [Rhodoferax jenense]
MLTLIVSVASFAATAALPHEGGRTLRVGPSQPLRTIAAAAAIAKPGDTVEIDAGDYIADVASWRLDHLTLRGVGGTARLIAAGKSAEGKAIWVISGKNVLVENIYFSGAKVDDNNGAGIRFEHGHLTVRNCVFLNNENGILTSNDNQAELVIENSEFGHGGGVSHNLYVGQIKKLTVTGSYFHHASVKHLLKSRASESFIFYNRLTDETGGKASYELDLPNGGRAYVVGNIIQQSSTTQNPIIIAYGEEGYTWPRNELFLAYNTIVDDYPKGGLFLYRKPGADKLVAANNVLVGSGPLEGSLGAKGAIFVSRLLGGKDPEVKDTAVVETQNNITTGWESFVRASRYDYRLSTAAAAHFKAIGLLAANGVPLVPQSQYAHPRAVKSLAASPVLPGAVQP